MYRPKQWVCSIVCVTHVYINIRANRPKTSQLRKFRETSLLSEVSAKVSANISLQGGPTFSSCEFESPTNDIKKR